MKLHPLYRKYLTTVAVIWAVSITLLTVFYVAFISPQRTRHQQLAQQIDQKQFEARSAERTADVQTMQELEQQVSRLGQKLSMFVSGRRQSANLIFDIGRLAQSKQVEAFSVGQRDNIASAGIPQCNYLERAQISISYNAAFNQFARLLNAMERHDPVIFIDSFRLTGPTRQGENPTVAMDLQVFIEAQGS